MRSHPGGALGQRLACQVGEIMFKSARAPIAFEDDTMAAALDTMDRFSLGAVLVLNRDNQVLGIITDGDIRHAIATGISDFAQMKATSIMTENPHTLGVSSYLYDALNLMEKYEITVLPIVDAAGRLEGLLHLHDILGKGSFTFNGGSQ